MVIIHRMTKRLAAGANVRVQEIFDRCPKVEEFLSCPLAVEGLIFVSAPRNFVTRAAARPRMRNVPRKHIGIILNGTIWHYSNSNRKVVKQNMAQFIHHYRRQQNALWYGSLPSGSKPTPAGVCVP